MPPLSSSDRRELLSRARQSIVESVVHDRLPELPPSRGCLTQFRGVFISLYHRGRLRGCIGRTPPTQPLGEAVAQCAITAARNDPRFAPVTAADLEALNIEISLLSEPQPVRLEALEIGTHGVLVVRGAKRALLLPQVAAERHWSAEHLVQETCRKAGLDPHAWKDSQTQLFAFTTETFSEGDLRAV